MSHGATRGRAIRLPPDHVAIGVRLKGPWACMTITPTAYQLVRLELGSFDYGLFDRLILHRLILDRLILDRLILDQGVAAQG